MSVTDQDISTEVTVVGGDCTGLARVPHPAWTAAALLPQRPAVIPERCIPEKGCRNDFENQCRKWCKHLLAGLQVHRNRPLDGPY